MAMVKSLISFQHDDCYATREIKIICQFYSTISNGDKRMTSLILTSGDMGDLKKDQQIIYPASLAGNKYRTG